MDGEVVVRPGQVWADNDARCKGRYLKVERLCQAPACLRGRSHGGHPDFRHAHCLVFWHPEEADAHIGRTDFRARTTIVAIRRLKPRSTGYRLIKEGDDAG